MPLTKAQTRDRAATELGIKRLNQPLTDKDKTRIESAYDEVYGYLKKEGLATWASTGSVPNDIAPYVVLLVALNCTETYSIPDSRMQRLVAKAGIDGNLALREIRKLVTPEYVSLDSPTDF